MKAILTFDTENLEEQKLLDRMLHVNDWIGVVETMAETMRHMLKYGHSYETPTEVLEALRHQLAEELSDHNLSLYD